MKIELDTNTLSDLDRAVLSLILGGEPAPAPAAEQPKPAPAKPKPAPARKATVEEVVAAAKPEPEVPTSEEAGDTGEDLIAPADSADPAPAEVTMSDAVAAATKLVSSGQSAAVKDALTGLGVKRVSELADDQIAAFINALPTA